MLNSRSAVDNRMFLKTLRKLKRKGLPLSPCIASFPFLLGRSSSLRNVVF